MPAGATYKQVNSTRLTATSASVTFSEIPNTYTDLILVSDIIGSSTASETRLRFNSDSTTNAYLFATAFQNVTNVPQGTSAQANYGAVSYGCTHGTTSGMTAITQIYQYCKSGVLRHWQSKAVALATDSSYNGNEFLVGYWNNTSVISSITVYPATGHFSVGASFSLYGISAA